MADSPSDEAVPLDATVGSFDQLEQATPFASAADAPFRVSVTGDAVLDAAARGWAEDVGLLVQGFVRRRASADRVRARPDATGEDRGRAEDDIQVSLHGLQLDPEAEDELHRMIRDLVRDRVSRAETAE